MRATLSARQMPFAAKLTLALSSLPPSLLCHAGEKASEFAQSSNLSIATVLKAKSFSFHFSTEVLNLRNALCSNFLPFIDKQSTLDKQELDKWEFRISGTQSQ